MEKNGHVGNFASKQKQIAEKSDPLSPSYLDHRVPRHVVLEPLQLQLQHGREVVEQDPLPRVLQAVVVVLVLVGAVERFDRGVRVERRVHVGAPFHVQLQVHERLGAGGHAVHVDALHKVVGVPLKQLRDRAVDRRPLHLGLQPLAQHPVQLLHVVLHERVHRVPPKGAGEVLGGGGAGAELELEEERLQRERHVLVGLVVGRGGHVVDGLAEGVDVVQGLVD